MARISGAWGGGSGGHVVSLKQNKPPMRGRGIPGTRPEKETSASRRRDVKWRSGVTTHRHGGKEKRPFNGPRL